MELQIAPSRFKVYVDIFILIDRERYITKV